MRASAILLLFAAAAATSRAQDTKTWTPAELAKRADVICTGTAIKAEVIDARKADDLLGYKPSAPKRVVVVQIKVVSRVKGAVPDEIEMRYPVHDERFKLEGAPDPGHVVIEPGLRYRFYLKRVEGEMWYAGALEGEPGDGAAVQPDEPREGSGPLLTKEQAVEIAKAFYLRVAPWAACDSRLTTAGYAKDQFPKWEVKLFSGKRRITGRADPDFDAKIIVNRDGTIDDRNSVICARISDQLDAGFTGSHVSLTVKAKDSDGVWGAAGVIKTVGKTTVTFQPDPTAATKEQTPVVIPKAAILTLQTLPPRNPDPGTAQ